MSPDPVSADLPRPVLPENDTAGAAGIHFSAAQILPAQPPEPQICNTPKQDKIPAGPLTQDHPFQIIL